MQINISNESNCPSVCFVYTFSVYVHFRFLSKAYLREILSHRENLSTLGGSLLSLSLDLQLIHPSLKVSSKYYVLFYKSVECTVSQCTCWLDSSCQLT